MPRPNGCWGGGVSAHSLGRDGWAQPGAQGPLPAAGAWRPEPRPQLFPTYLHACDTRQTVTAGLMSCAPDQSPSQVSPPRVLQAKRGIQTWVSSVLCIHGRVTNRHGQLPSGHQPNQGTSFETKPELHASWQTKSGRGFHQKAWPRALSLLLGNTGLLAPCEPLSFLWKPSRAG